MALGLLSFPMDSSEPPASFFPHRHPKAHHTLFQTEYSQQAGTESGPATLYRVTDKTEKEMEVTAISFPSRVRINNPFFITKEREAASRAWSFTFINKVLSTGHAWNCAQL